MPRYRRFTARFVHRPGHVHRFAGDPYWGGRLLTLAPAAWRPAVDVCETREGLVVVLELAGLDEEDTDVTLYADALVVEGERTLAACGTDGTYHRAEIRQGPFRVEMPLPFPVDADRVEATYERGLLTVRLPATREAQS